MLKILYAFFIILVALLLVFHLKGSGTDDAGQSSKISIIYFPQGNPYSLKSTKNNPYNKDKKNNEKVRVDDFNFPAGRKSITLGRVPFTDVREMYAQHEEFIAYLKKKLNIEINLKFYVNYSKMIDGILAGEVQIAWLGPVSYVVAMDRLTQAGKKFSPIVKPMRRNTFFLQCDIIARKDSKLKSLNDLEGKKIAFLDPKSSAGFVLPLATFETAKVKIATYNDKNFLRQYGNIVRAVYLGKFDAGATFEDAYKTFLTEDEQLEMKVLTKSETVPFEPICCVENSILDKNFSKKLQNVLLELSDTSILKNLEIQKFLPADESEYISLTNLVKKVLSKNEKIFE